jgi:hypothetical protein
MDRPPNGAAGVRGQRLSGSPGCATQATSDSGSATPSGSVSNFRSQPTTGMPQGSSATVMQLRGATAAVHTLPNSPASLARKPGAAGGGMRGSALSPGRVSDSGAAAHKQDSNSRQLLTTHKQLRQSQQQQQQHAFFTLDGDEPEAHEQLATPARSTPEFDPAYDPQLLFEESPERPEAVLQLHDSSSSLASVPAHLAASPMPSGHLPSKPLMLLHPADEEGALPQRLQQQQPPASPVPLRQASSTPASPLANLWSMRQRDQDERPSGPLAMLRDR